MATLLEDLMKRKAGGFAPTAPTPDFQMQRPQVAPTPQVGPTIATEPQLSDGITFPGLDQIGAAGAAEFNAPQPLTAELPTLEAQGRAGAEQFYAERAAARPVEDDSFFGNIGAAFKSSTDRPVGTGGGVNPFGGGTSFSTTQTLPQIATGAVKAAGTEYMDRASAVRDAIPMGVPGARPFEEPASIAPAPIPAGVQQPVVGMSVNGAAPLTPESITGAGQVATSASAPIAAAPTPQAGSGGLISFDTGARAGQTFFGDETGVGAVTQGNAAQINQGFDDTYGTRSAGDISITGPDGQSINPNSTRYDPARLTPAMQANVDAGRPPNVSASQVAGAERQMQQQEVESAADRAAAEYGKNLPLNGQSIGARDEKVAEFRAAYLMDAQDKLGKSKTNDGLTVDQQLKIDQMNYDRGQDSKEEAATSQEEATRDQGIYDMYNDNFSRQERYIEQSLKNTGAMSTGFASIAKILPGTKARDLEESLKPILGEAAFGRLQQMRDASKTGGALGAISKNELDLLEAAMGALSTSQNEAQFRSNLLAYRKQLRESNGRIQAAYNKKYKGESGATQTTPKYKDDVNTSQRVDEIYNPSPSK